MMDEPIFGGGAGLAAEDETQGARAAPGGDGGPVAKVQRREHPMDAMMENMMRNNQTMMQQQMDMNQQMMGNMMQTFMQMMERQCQGGAAAATQRGDNARPTASPQPAVLPAVDDGGKVKELLETAMREDREELERNFEKVC